MFNLYYLGDLKSEINNLEKDHQMAFKLQDVNRSGRNISFPETKADILRVPGSYSDIKSALLIAKSQQVIEIAAGLYKENIINENIDLSGVGEVTIDGDITLSGSGKLTNIICNNLTITGTWILTDIQAKKLTIKDGSIETRYSYIDELICEKGSVVMSNSTISTRSEYAVEMSDSYGLFENIHIVGPLNLEENVTLTCSQVRFTCTNHVDLIETKNETTIVYLFNCIAAGNAKIKSGNGTTYRSNLIGLGTATELVGGENLILQPI